MKTYTIVLDGRSIEIQRDDDGKFILPDELKSWQSHKTPQLKPAWEPILCFRAPNGGKNYSELALEFGSGCLNVAGGRIGAGEQISGGGNNFDAWRAGENRSDRPAIHGVSSSGHSLGRYPANLAFECTCETTELVEAPVNGDVSGSEPSEPTKNTHGKYNRKAFKAHQGKMVKHTDPNCPARMLDEQSGKLASGALDRSKITAENKIYGKAPKNRTGTYEPNAGGASRFFAVVKYASEEMCGNDTPTNRFFYAAKASRSERDAGLDSFPLKNNMRVNAPRESEEEKTKEASRNNHPTVKPIALNKWLATLLLPPASVKPRRILVPFCGSGSEAIGAALAGWDEVIAIEREKEYWELACARFAHWTKTKRKNGNPTKALSEVSASS